MREKYFSAGYVNAVMPAWLTRHVSNVDKQTMGSTWAQGWHQPGASKQRLCTAVEPLSEMAALWGTSWPWQASLSLTCKPEPDRDSKVLSYSKHLSIKKHDTKHAVYFPSSQQVAAARKYTHVFDHERVRVCILGGFGCPGHYTPGLTLAMRQFRDCQFVKQLNAR